MFRNIITVLRIKEKIHGAGKMHTVLYVVHSVEQKSIGLIFRTSRSGSNVRLIRVVLLYPYLCIHGVSLSSILYN